MESSNTSNNGLSENKHSETDQQKSLSQPSPNSSSQRASTNAATNLCIVCSTRQRALAFVPCGHFAVCVQCGHGLKSCPTCGSNIKGLLRIFS
jgi:hypothetical protein